MSKYNFENVMYGNGEFRKEFEDYVHETFSNSTAVLDMDSEESKKDGVATVDTYAAYYMFRSEKGDLSEEEKDKIDSMMSLNEQENPEEYRAERDALANAYWGKNYEDLPLDKQFFVKAAHLMSANHHVSVEDITKRHEEDLMRQIEEEEKAKAAREAAEAEARAKATTVFNNKEAVYEGFRKLADNQYGEAPKEEIEEFIKNKNAYITGHPEERDEVEGRLGEMLNSTEDQIYGSDVYQISDSFREQYKALNELMAIETFDEEITQENIAKPVNSDDRDNDGSEDNGGKGDDGILNVGVIPGSRGNEKPGNDGNGDGGSFGIGGTGDNGGDDKADEKEEYMLGRIRSAYSDCNEQWIRWEKLSALKSMGVVKEEIPPMGDVEATVDLMLKYEPNLSKKEAQEMTARVTEKIVSDDQLLESAPPSVLASMYTDFSEEAKNEKDEEKRNAVYAKLNRVAVRIDDLTAMVAKERELYFADVTNIADVYDGYNKMFAARYNDLLDEASNGTTDEAKVSAGEKLQQQQEAARYVSSRMDEYDHTYSLDGISAEKADDLDKRFDQMREAMSGVEITPETAQLVANFKFLNREYSALDNEQRASLQEKFPEKDFSAIESYDKLNSDELKHLSDNNLLPKAEPQFVDQDGNQSDKWSEGAKVIPGSKLDKAITAAKQSVMLQNLGTDTEITPEFLQQELCAQLPKTLYSLHVTDLVSQGAVERVDQFTNPVYLERFMQDLGNLDKTMAIGPHSFDAGLDNIVNQTGGYAQRLSQRLSKDSSGHDVAKPNLNVTTKLFEPIQSIDKNAKDRLTTTQTGKQGYFKNLAKTFVSAATMSAVMRVVGTAAQSATGVAWAGAGIGSVIGIATTAYQITQWNKQRKDAGLDTSFKSFVKDRRMMMTLGTTALGCVATGLMAVPGLQPAALVVGGAAMAVGAANGAITAYQAARASGEGKWKSCMKALGIVGAAGLGAFTGMKVADAGINAYNKYNPDNEIFQHKKEVKISDGTEGKQETVIDRDALEADSKRYNEQYNISDRVHHGMSHDDYMKAVDNYNAAHPDAPITNPDELLKHAYNAQNGRVYGPGYVAEHGLDPDVVNKVGHLISPDGSINPDAVKAWNGSDLWRQSGLQNFVQRVHESVDLRPDLYPNRTPESTYSDPNMPTKTIETPGTDPVYATKIIPNDRPLGFAMVGVLGNLVTKVKKLKNPIGSLLDAVKTIGKKTKPQTKIPPKGPENPPIPPVVDKPKGPENPPIPPVVDKPKDPKEDDKEIRRLLNEEYQILTGINPTRQDPAKKTSEGNVADPMANQAYVDYCKRVEAERVADGGKPMLEYLQGRRQDLDKAVGANLASYLSSSRARLDANIWDPTGYNQATQKAYEDKQMGRKPSKEATPDPIKIPSTEKVKAEYLRDRPTSRIVAVIRQEFNRSDNGSSAGGEGKFSFKQFIGKAKEFLTSSKENVDRDATKAPVRRIEGKKTDRSL